MSGGVFLVNINYSPWGIIEGLQLCLKGYSLVTMGVYYLE